MKRFTILAATVAIMAAACTTACFAQSGYTLTKYDSKQLDQSGNGVGGWVNGPTPRGYAQCSSAPNNGAHWHGYFTFQFTSIKGQPSVFPTGAYNGESWDGAAGSGSSLSNARCNGSTAGDGSTSNNSYSSIKTITPEPIFLTQEGQLITVYFYVGAQGYGTGGGDANSVVYIA